MTGTSGDLIDAARVGLHDIEHAVERPRATGFRHSPRLLETVVRFVGQR